MKGATCALLLALVAAASAQAIPASPFSTCPTADGATESVNGYTATPYVFKNMFTQTFKNPAILNPIQFAERSCREDKHCISSYEIEVKNEQLKPFNTIIPACAALPGTHFLTYNGEIPGPTIIAPTGHETIVRFTNNIGGPFSATVSPCDKPGRSGRPFSVHLHGSASAAPFDGWAEDETCRGETKEYIYPNNRPGTGWYHDHALHITADNAYFGLAGMYHVSSKIKHGGCGEPWNLEAVEELHMIFQDKVLNSQCQQYIDHADVHTDDLYGDINLVSGIPFPKFELQPKFYRMRLLNVAVSRPYIIKIKDENLNDVAPGMCHIIAADGGYRAAPVAFPPEGLFVAVAERWEVVCDFSQFAGRTLWLYNDRDDEVMRDTPYFCHSHLLGKIEVAAGSRTGAVFDPTSTAITPLQPLYKVLSDADMAAARAMVAAGESHRTMKFGKSGSQWTINGHTWESFRIAAADVGQNTWEVWRFETGGGWFHPIHVHLVDMFLLSRDRDGGLKTYEEDSPKDVFFLGPSQTVYFVARFGAHRGDFMFHCHNLLHEDNDMMRAFQIVPGGRNAPSAAKFLEVNNIVYSNWKYSDPMNPDTLAKPTGDMPALTQLYEVEVLKKNIYEIFYPDSASAPILMGDSNPWRSVWSPNHCTVPTGIVVPPNNGGVVPPNNGGVVPPNNGGGCNSIKLLPGYKLNGKVFSRTRGVTLASCQDSCVSNARCKSFSFQISKLVCELYRLPAQNLRPRKKAGFTSGTKDCP